MKKKKKIILFIILSLLIAAISYILFINIHYDGEWESGDWCALVFLWIVITSYPIMLVYLFIFEQ